MFIGTNSSGNNAYFVRKDKIGKTTPCSVRDGYVESRYRESRDAEGRLTFVAGRQRLKIIEDMPVYNVENGRVVKIKDLDEGGTGEPS